MTMQRILYKLMQLAAEGRGRMRCAVTVACRALAICLMTGLALTSCEVTPPLHLHRDEVGVELPIVQLDLNVYWQYDLTYDIGYGLTYDWNDEWEYGWDETDQRIFSQQIGYTQPTSFNIRRYHLGYDTLAAHTQPDHFHIDGTRLTTTYKYGYHDLLAWSDITTDVQSILIDETTTYDSVVAYTNMTNSQVRYHSPKYNYSFNQPEDLFSGYVKNVYISRNPEDYDWYDADENIYFKYIDMDLRPCVYIYLTQVILHNNHNKVVGTDGEANLSGMARSTNLNTGHTGTDAISVKYNTRMKQDVTLKDQSITATADIIGGRLTTFGICGLDPNNLHSPLEVPGYRKLIASNRYGTRAFCSTRGADATGSSDAEGTSGSAEGNSPLDDDTDPTHHYIDVNLIFNNGCDSTLVFDVSDQVVERYRGGVITIHIDMDTVPIPLRSGGSGFDAVVQDYDSVTYSDFPWLEL